MKKIISITLCLIITFSLFSVNTFNAFAITSGTTGDCTWTLNGTELTISGTGAMGDYTNKTTLPWGTSITKVTIESGVTAIGTYVFYGCNKLTSIEIPDSVTTIGWNAFYYCYSLESIEIPDSVTTIGWNAFSNTAFYNTSSNWKNDVLYIGNYLIQAKNTLPRDYAIKDGTKCIADSAFDGCTSLTSIEIPDSVTSIGINAFYNCTSLTSIEIPDSVTTIGSGTFRYCTRLTSIEIPDGVTSIGTYAFYSCTSLASIEIPDSVTTIGDYAFYNCTSLKDIYYTGTKEQWDQLQGKPSGTVHYICKSNQHVYDNDCDETCNTCGYVRTAHSYSELWSHDGTQHWHECRRCGNKTDVANHIYDNNCDTMCSVCGYVREISHAYKTTWSKNSSQHWHECTVCGDKIDVAAHVFDNACDTTCNTCGYVRTVPHFRKEFYYPCSICGNYETRITAHGEFESGAKWSLDGNTNTLYLYGAGATDGYKTASAAPWYSYSNSITSVYVEKEVTKLGNYLFNSLNNLTKVTILNNDIAFGYYVFNDNVNPTFYGPNSGNLRTYTTNNNYVLHKIANPCTPINPVLLVKTKTSLVFNSVSGYEYSLNGIAWQNSSVFNNVPLDATYTVYQRLAETYEYAPSEKSEGLTVNTLKLPDTPSKPTIESYTCNSVTLVPDEAFEYSLDKNTWQASNMFTGLKTNTVYSFYRRTVPQGEYVESNASEAVKIIFVATPTIDSYGNGTVTLNNIAEFQYSNDNIVWQDSNVFTKLIPEEIYEFYQRPKNTIGINIVYLDDSGNISIALSHTQTIAHAYSTDWYKNETNHWHECSECQDKIDIAIHVYDNACDTTCNVCGYVRTVEPHAYSTTWLTNSAQHWHECTVCGDKKDLDNHVFDNACDTTCNICGYVRTVKPHSYSDVWSQDGTQHWHECTVCGDKKDLAAHVFDNDCDATCNVCGYVRETTHSYSEDWSNDETNHWHVCTVCGDKADIADHVYDDDHDATCNVCGYERTVSAYTPGDINGDGGIDDKDISALKRYLAGWDIIVVEALLDINGDGVVDDKDANYLARSLAGWSGYEL